MKYDASENSKSEIFIPSGDYPLNLTKLDTQASINTTSKKASRFLSDEPKGGHEGSVLKDLLSEACSGCELKAKYQKANNERGYWQKMHQKAVEREAKLKIEIDELKAKLRLREHQLFGRKSEQRKKKNGCNEGTKQRGENKRKRGQQKESRGHGRSDNSHLPAAPEFHDLDHDKKQCPCCGLPFNEFVKTEDSEQIVVEVRAHRRVIRRKQYKPTCKCDCNPGLIIAPGPSKLIPKGLIDISTWVMILLDKFLYYRPTNRLLEQWKSYDVYLSQGTVTDGLKRLSPLFKPIEAEIMAVHSEEDRWCADETRWMVFETVEGKAGYRWYLWVFKSPSSVVYRLDPTRSAKVPEQMLGEVEGGILLVDRYVAYKVLLKNGKIIIAFCWAHVRRDFLDVARDWPKQEAWAMKWVEDIGNLYHLNDLRLERVEYEIDFLKADTQLREAVHQMAKKAEEQLAEETLHPASRKVLESLQNHWEGLTVFVDHPDVPMDNNESERLIRGPAIGRKMYYGSGSVWSGTLAVRMFTIFQTLLLWDINPRLWLTVYLQACAEAGGNVPADPSSFLPWNLPDEQRSTLTINRPDTS